jgi:hypothetical protein
VRVGKLIPWLILLFCSLEVASRFVPVESFAFRAWEPMSLNAGPTGPFEANKTFTNPLSYGDLAHMSNRRSPREYHYERFTTDAYGFRNPPELSRGELGPVEAILVGDSYAVGSGVPDGETLAAQIGTVAGHLTYNAGSHFPIFLEDIRAIARRLNMQRGVVVYEFLERQIKVYDVASFAAARAFTDGPPSHAPSWEEQLTHWRTEASISRTAVFLDTVRSLYFEPENANDPSVAAFHLDNGTTMLFFRGAFSFVTDTSRRISPDYYLWLSRELARDNLKLVILLVPDKLAVYQRHITDVGAPKSESDALDRFERDLSNAAIPSVNLRHLFRSKASEEMKNGRYLYFLDDTHWNARGIRVAAQALSTQWPK